MIPSSRLMVGGVAGRDAMYADVEGGKDVLRCWRSQAEVVVGERAEVDVACREGRITCVELG